MSLKTANWIRKGLKGILGLNFLKDLYEDLNTLRTDVDTNTTDITALEAAAPDTTWTDYSTSSTVIGWSSVTKTIKYFQEGKKVTIRYSLYGTSNSTAASFTIPFTANGAQNGSISYVIDNNVAQAYPGYVSISHNSATVNLLPSVTVSTWTNSNLKYAIGTIVLEIN